MKVLFINSVCGSGSTGKICVSLAKELEQQGHEVKIACGARYPVSESGKKYAVPIGNDTDMYLHLLKSRLLDRHCFGSKAATKRFIKWAEEYNPDILWLHNLHGYYLNIKVLFDWIKSRPQMQVKWTLHDCWAFTGHCTYFDVANCDNWKEGCHNCPQKKKYPRSIGLDNSKIMIVFSSEERVDFRELLKVLSSKLKVRIELKQIAPRDRAQLVGGLGPCGLPLCCATFLGEFDGISLNRAKNQLLSINIPKLSGQCGKLMCCLKYEQEVYRKIQIRQSDYHIFRNRKTTSFI